MSTVASLTHTMAALTLRVDSLAEKTNSKQRTVTIQVLR